MLCPYAWRTSLWMREVAQLQPVEVTWKQFSLAIVNNAEPDSPRAQKGFLCGRLFIAAERLGGNAAVDRLYLALGNALHGEGKDPLDQTVLASVLTTAGLPADLGEIVMADETTLAEYRESHEDGVRHGAFGVPSLVFEGEHNAYFGPVVDPIPTGEKALELWDFTRWAARQPYLWEIKRDRKGHKLAPQYATLNIEAVADTTVDGDACARVPSAR